MGWWATDVFGGDVPLDFVDFLEERLETGCLYPLSRWTPKTTATVRERLTPKLDEFFTKEIRLYTNIWRQVLICVAMAAGCPLSDTHKAIGRAAAEADAWASEDQGRADQMRLLAAAIEDYDGSPLILAHTGLFQAMATRQTASVNLPGINS